MQPYFQAEDSPWRDRVVAHITEALEAHDELDIISMIRELRSLLGESGVEDLGQHLDDNGSNDSVDDFLQKCLWHGLSRGLWNHQHGIWQDKS